MFFVVSDFWQPLENNPDTKTADSRPRLNQGLAGKIGEPFFGITNNAKNVGECEDMALK